MSNNKEVRLSKSFFNTEQVKKVVDTEFTQIVPVVPEEVNDTVTELFRLYEKLYFSIPVEGETNSHEYLVRRSSEVVQLEDSEEDIQPFLDEIAQLREQLLLANETILELQNTIAGNE